MIFYLFIFLHRLLDKHSGLLTQKQLIKETWQNTVDKREQIENTVQHRSQHLALKDLH